jgi:hypothetical protein
VIPERRLVRRGYGEGEPPNPEIRPAIGIRQDAIGVSPVFRVEPSTIASCGPPPIVWASRTVFNPQSGSDHAGERALAYPSGQVSVDKLWGRARHHGDVPDGQTGDAQTAAVHGG